VAIVRARFDKDEVICRGDFVILPVDLEPPALCRLHLCSSVVLLTEVIANFSERSQLLPASDERAGAADTVALARHLHVADNRPPSRLVVVEVHELPAVAAAPSLLVHLPLADIDEVLSKFVSIMNIVAASSPDPLRLEIIRPLCSGTSAAGELSISAPSGHAVNHPSTRHGISKRCLARRYSEDRSKDCGVVDCGAVPSSVPELELALADASAGATPTWIM